MIERKDKYFFECIFIDGTKENFNNLCTTVEEFGSNNDMIAFKARNYDTNNSVLLQLVPKSQIKQIINNYEENDIRKVFNKD